MMEANLDPVIAAPQHVLAPRKIGRHPRDAASGIHGSPGGTNGVLYADPDGVVQLLAFGDQGTVLVSAGVAGPLFWATPASLAPAMAVAMAAALAALAASSPGTTAGLAARSVVHHVRRH